MGESGMDSLGNVTLDSSVEIENQSDNSSGSSLFTTQCVPYSPKQRQRSSIRKFVPLSESVQARDSSSDSSIEPVTLKAIFDRYKNRKRKHKKRKYKPTGRKRGRPKGRKNTRSSRTDKKLFNKGPGFPFVESENEGKPLPWRKILTYEQAVARGFFNYIEKLKYEHYLKESLNQMDAGEDLEKEDFDSRRYKYLDDDGSISPIEESAAEDEDAAHGEHGECDIKLGADDSFIISSDFPRKINVYLEQNNGTKEAALSKKRATRARSSGQRTPGPEKETGT
ncbi:TATA box-binding protein-associated factor RNA polymerase I subunit D [Nycticebus coucang]|uniref:TATA box-binding protein-associated factor RNA polymerase I subunit D n=1 Tax=Nycticebus coucang TaxID=9470 RepID=UPI00234E1992|nr:TATA box-binding protein-associated factor RNA polymerase I subunit D [Nycticebus coucang]XP_053415979.1 TATA box-binding protein-associated factor RNA polymerase I subunit D [Nycticebus coucang]XP_053415980.1 TATA box-binding protein-associated factor RNA polymerase I subunit D [Nycticebus coucang]